MERTFIPMWEKKTETLDIGTLPALPPLSFYRALATFQKHRTCREGTTPRTTQRTALTHSLPYAHQVRHPIIGDVI